MITNGLAEFGNRPSRYDLGVNFLRLDHRNLFAVFRGGHRLFKIFRKFCKLRVFTMSLASSHARRACPTPKRMKSKSEMLWAPFGTEIQLAEDNRSWFYEICTRLKTVGCIVSKRREDYWY